MVSSSLSRRLTSSLSSVVQVVMKLKASAASLIYAMKHSSHCGENGGEEAVGAAADVEEESLVLKARAEDP